LTPRSGTSDRRAADGSHVPASRGSTVISRLEPVQALLEQAAQPVRVSLVWEPQYAPSGSVACMNTNCLRPA
jgi:hypothetical protein